MIEHPIPPFYDKNSRILILGSFPSVKSREMKFFYGHPQNRFWRVLSIIYEDAFPETVEARAAFLTRHRIAAWDVIKSCDITGSSDASIRNVTPNDLSVILDAADIRTIYVNGKTAEKLYRKYTEEKPGGKPSCCPRRVPPTRRGASSAWLRRGAWSGSRRSRCATIFRTCTFFIKIC